MVRLVLVNMFSARCDTFRGQILVLYIIVNSKIFRLSDEHTSSGGATIANRIVDRLYISFICMLARPSKPRAV